MKRTEPWYESENPTRIAELAWAAGLFEGEGSVTAKLGKGTGHRYQAAIIMTDEDVVRRFGEVVGIGQVYGPYRPTNPNAQLIWRWTTTKVQEIEKLWGMIGALLGKRRRGRFEMAVADIRDHPAQTWFHKLSPEVHAAIRCRYAAGGVTQQALGAEYGVTQSMVSVIVRSPMSSTNPSDGKEDSK